MGAAKKMKFAKEIVLHSLILVIAGLIGTTIFSTGYYYFRETQDMPFGASLLITYLMFGFALLFLIPLYIITWRLLPSALRVFGAALTGVLWCPLQFINPIRCSHPSGWVSLSSLMLTASVAVVLAIGIAWTVRKLRKT